MGQGTTASLSRIYERQWRSLENSVEDIYIYIYIDISISLNLKWVMNLGNVTSHFYSLA